MGLDANAYARQLRQLLPPGVLWRTDQDSWLWKFLLGIADELARVDARCDALVNEWDPRTALETLEDWERVLDLHPAADATVAERQIIITSAIVARGGSTPAYFIALAAQLGFVATVEEPGTTTGSPITLVGVGSLSSAGAPTVPVGYEADDILVVVVAGSPTAPAGWARVAYDTGYLGVYWKRSTASESTPSFGAGLKCRMAAYRGAVAAGDPFEVVGTVGTASGALSFASAPGADASSITTLTAGSLILLACGDYSECANTMAGIGYGAPAFGQPATTEAFSSGGDSSAALRGIGLWHGIQLAIGATGVASGAHVTLEAEDGSYHSAAVLLALKPASLTLPAHTWRLVVDLAASWASYALRTSEARTGTAYCGDPISSVNVDNLEAVINKAKPAHTVLYFYYSS